MFFFQILLLCSLSAAHLIEVSQPLSVKTVKLGDSVTIQCHIRGNFDFRVWYRLTSANTLKFVATYDSRYGHVDLHEDLVGRYSVVTEGIKYHLKISTTTWTDIGTYFCGVIRLDRVQFGRGTFLKLEGANVSNDYVIQTPSSQPVPPGASVTLHCSVHTDHCTSNHTSVTWLKTPKNPPPEMVHWSGSDESRCMNETCVYDLLLKNLSSEDSGTFYCVAAACGQLLLGGGTELNFTNNISDGSVAAIFVSIIIFTLIFLTSLCLFITSKCSERQVSYTDSKGNGTWSQCVYFRKKLS